MRKSSLGRLFPFVSLTLGVFVSPPGHGAALPPASPSLCINRQVKGGLAGKKYILNTAPTDVIQVPNAAPGGPWVSGVPEDCFAEDVLVINGAALVNGAPVVECLPKPKDGGPTNRPEAGAPDAADAAAPDAAVDASGQPDADLDAATDDAADPDAMPVLDADLDAVTGALDGPIALPPMPAPVPTPVAVSDLDVTNCVLRADRAVTRAIEVMKGMADVKFSNKQWDQFVVFGSDITPKSDVIPNPNAPAPLFFREGADPQSPDPGGVNEVAGIGLPVQARNPDRPLVGWIHAGNTAQVPASPATGAYANCGPAQSGSTSVVAPNPGLCSGGHYTYFDALAQATGAMFGPYIKAAVGGKQIDLAVLPTSKTALVDKDGVVASEYAVIRPRIWNSFFNTRGSLFGGNTWNDNGNGTYDSTKMSPYYGINPPWGRAETAVKNGNQIVRFIPIDLYLMGFLPPTDRRLAGTPMQVFHDIQASSIYRPQNTLTFDRVTGPGMGIRTGVGIRPMQQKAGAYDVRIEDVLSANAVRVPAYEAAPHVIKQLWIVVTKPKEVIENLTTWVPPDGGAPEPGTDAGFIAIRAAENTALVEQMRGIVNVVTWRRQWMHYFYMLTGYRGRILTSFNGTADGTVDDMAYWEFGAPEDDGKGFKFDGGLLAKMPGHELGVSLAAGVATNPANVQNVIHVDSTPGEAGMIRYQAPAGGPAMRIDADTTSKWLTNGVTIRMRIEEGGVPWSTASASFEFTGGPKFKLPDSCGAKADCTEIAFLVPDGKWHNYTAILGSTYLAPGKTFSGFTFVPSNVPAKGIDIEFIRVGNLPAATDVDKACVAPGKSRVLGRQTKPDGWVDIDGDDNCKTLFNPDQADGNDDGIGDACEDFDGDSVENSCDNCPTTTNSQQQDKDGDGIGDACDGKMVEPCLLKPKTLAGAVPARPSAPVLVIFLGIGLIAAFRSIRRR